MACPSPNRLRSSWTPWSEVSLRRWPRATRSSWSAFEEAYLGQLALEVDNLGWKPLGTGVQTEDNGLRLDHIKNQAELGMALVRPTLRSSAASVCVASHLG